MRKNNKKGGIYSFPCAYATSFMKLYEVFPKFKKENYRKDLEKNQDFGGSKSVWNNKSVSYFTLFLDLD